MKLRILKNSRVGAILLSERGEGGGEGWGSDKKMVKIKTEVDGYTRGEGGRSTEIGCPEL